MREVRPDALIHLLASTTRTQLAFARSSRARESMRRCQPRPAAREVLPFLEGALSERQQLRIGAALASTLVRRDDRTSLTLSQLLVGSAPERAGGWKDSEVRGLSQRPLADVLADAATWVDQHVAHPPGVGRGLRLVHHRGYRCPWGDAHAWLAGDLDSARLEEALLAFLALDWRDARVGPVDAPSRVPVPVPSLAILAGFAAGSVVAPLGARRSRRTGGDSPGDGRCACELVRRPPSSLRRRRC